MKTLMKITLVILLLTPSLLLSKVLSNYDQGIILYNKKKYELALVYFERAFKESPMKNDLYFYLGNIYNHKKMFLESIEAYKRGLDIVSGKTKIIYLYNLAKSYQGAKMYKDALKTYRYIGSKTDKYPAIYLYMGMIYFNLKNKDETIKAWEIYLVKAPNNLQYESVRKAINILKNKNFIFPVEKDKYKTYIGRAVGKEQNSKNKQNNKRKNTKDIYISDRNVKVNSQNLIVKNKGKKEGKEYNEIEK